MKLESIQIPNFLSENLVDKLLNLYFKSCQIIGSKIHELKFDEVHYTGTKIKRFDFIDAKFENTINETELESRIKDQTAFYVPEIEITNLILQVVPDEHTLYIRLTYKFLLDNTEDSIQLNFR